MTFKPDQISALQAPLDSRHVKGRSQGGRTVSYVEGWHAIAEANRIFGFDMWSRETIDLRVLGEPREVDGKMRVGYSARVRITVTTPEGREITREGCGFGQGIDKDVDQAHESALKEAETDAMKRAFMTFGNPFGLALYDKDRANVADGQQIAVQALADKHKAAFKAATSLDGLKAAWEAALKDKNQFSAPLQQDLRKAMMDRMEAIKAEDNPFPPAGADDGDRPAAH